MSSELDWNDGEKVVEIADAWTDEFQQKKIVEALNKEIKRLAMQNKDLRRYNERQKQFIHEDDKEAELFQIDKMVRSVFHKPGNKERTKDLVARLIKDFKDTREQINDACYVLRSKGEYYLN
jgi:predicted RNase H-like nuclease (RuvC/YqgF family)